MTGRLWLAAWLPSSVNALENKWKAGIRNKTRPDNIFWVSLIFQKRFPRDFFSILRMGPDKKWLSTSTSKYYALKDKMAIWTLLNHQSKNIWASLWENRLFAYWKTKPQISCAVTAQLISAFVFATRIVQSLFFLNPKFQASSYLLWLHSPVCVGPGRKPRRPVFS